jgi:hypothetical protein
VSRVFEYVQKIRQARRPARLGHALPHRRRRRRARPLRPPRSSIKAEGDTLAELDGSSFDIKAARKIVFQANKSRQVGDRARELRQGQASSTPSHFWALVDRAAESVYAFKARIVHKKTGVAKDGYAPLRFYGADDAETVDGVPAVEEAKQPPASQIWRLCRSVYEDKGFDELTDADITFAPPARRAPAPAATMAGGAWRSQRRSVTHRKSSSDALNANIAAHRDST